MKNYKTCPECGSIYNTETVSQCPACKNWKRPPRKRSKTQSDSRRIHAQVESYKKEMRQQYRHYSSGARHVKKTKGRSL